MVFRTLAVGEVLSLPLKLDLDANFLFVLLEGSVHSDAWGEIRAPAILSNQLPLAATSLSGVRFKEAGQMVVMHDSSASTPFQPTGNVGNGPPYLGLQSSAASTTTFKRKMHGRYLKVK